MCAMVSNRPGRACKPGTELIRTETLKEGKKVTHRRDVTSGKERVCVCVQEMESRVRIWNWSRSACKSGTEGAGDICRGHRGL